MIDRPQAEALASFVTRVRPDWRHAGIIAAIEKVKHESAIDIARALVNLAEDMTLKTPALLAGPGGHWRKPDGTMSARRGDHNVSCIDHPHETHPCPVCPTEKRPPTPDDIAAAKAAVEENLRRTKLHHAEMQRLRDEREALA